MLPDARHTGRQKRHDFPAKGPDLPPIPPRWLVSGGTQAAPPTGSSKTYPRALRPSPQLRRAGARFHGRTPSSWTAKRKITVRNSPCEIQRDVDGYLYRGR